MSLDPALWSQLEEHGVSEAHLEMLLRALETQRNGSLAWHYAHGRVCTCDLRVTMPGRSYDLRTVTETVLGEGHGLLR